MAAYDGAIRIKTDLNTNSFNTGVKGMLSGLKSIAGAVGVAFSVAALAKFGKECIELSSDLAEVDNVVSKAFGNYRSEMDELANKSIKTLGMSRLTAYQVGSTFMSMGKSMLSDQKAAADMAIELTKLTGNMASFKNESQELAATKIKSIYTGETETLKEWGVVMTEANLKQFALTQGITKSYSAMSQEEKVMLRYNYVMNQLNFVGSDFTDTQDSWANQTRILSEQWKEFMTVLGNGLVTVLTPVIHVLNNIVSALITFANAVGTVLTKVFGLKAQTLSATTTAEDTTEAYEEASDAVSDYGDSTEEAAKQAKSSLSSLDDFNNITTSSSSSGSGSGSGSGSSGGTITAEDTEADEGEVTKLEGRLAQFKSYVASLQADLQRGWSDAFDMSGASEKIGAIKKNLSSITSSIKAVFTDPAVEKGFTNMVSTWAYSLGSIAGSIASIGLNLAQGITSGIAQWFTQETPNIQSYLIQMFNLGGRVAQIQADVAAALATISQAFTGAEFTSTISNFIGIFSSAFMNINLLASKFAVDVAKMLTTPFVDNAPAIQAALKGLLSVISSVLGTIRATVNNTFAQIQGLYDKHIKPVFTQLGQGLSEILSSLLEFWNASVRPMLSEMATQLDALFENYIQPLINNFIGLLGEVIDLLGILWTSTLVPLITWIIDNILPKVLPIVQTLYNSVVKVIANLSTAINGIITVLRGIITFITGVFTGDWKTAWTGIKTIFSGIWTAIKGIVSTVISAIAGIIKTGFATIKTAFSGLWSFIKGIINTMLAGIQIMVNGLIKCANKIIDFLNTLKVDIPDWVPEVGGNSIGFNLNKISEVTIPKLANGGITTGSTLAQIGEAGREAVLPLEHNTEWIEQLANSLADKMQTSVVFSVEGDEAGIFKVTQKQAQEYFNRTGNAAFAY